MVVATFISVGTVDVVGGFLAFGVVWCPTLSFLGLGSVGLSCKAGVLKEVKSISRCVGGVACDLTGSGCGSCLVSGEDLKEGCGWGASGCFVCGAAAGSVLWTAAVMVADLSDLAGLGLAD